MGDTYTGSDPSYSRNWRGNYHTWMRAHTKEYNFPVTVRRIGDNEKQPAETSNN
jgi:hypothetical protein